MADDQPRITDYEAADAAITTDDPADLADPGPIHATLARDVGESLFLAEGTRLRDLTPRQLGI